MEHPQTAVLRSGQAVLDLLDQVGGPPGLLRAGLGSVQHSEDVRLDGRDRSQLVHTGVQGDTVVIEAAPVFFGVVVVAVGPDLPAEKFFLADKVLTGQPDMYAGRSASSSLMKDGEM